MKQVLAVLNGMGQYLYKDEQIDEFLSKRYTLYLEENGKREILATPEDGFFKERPSLVQTKVFNLKG